MDIEGKFSSLPSSASSSSEADARKRELCSFADVKERDLFFFPDAKKPRGELLLPSRKVCIICGSSTELVHDWVIFVVDLIDSVYGNEMFIPGDPTLRLSWGALGIRAFCVWNSMLYMFEGYDENTNPDGGRSVFTYDLSLVDDHNTFNLRLEERMLGKKPNMLHPKKSPVAVPTPDGKIVVFSSQILIPASDLNADEKIDFELYDPINESWRELPAICPPWRKANASIVFRIEAYGFISKSVLFLQTKIGMFCLDLESPYYKGWVHRDGWAGATKIPINGGPFSVIGDGDLCVTPQGIYDVTKGNGFSQSLYKIRPSFGKYHLLAMSRMITLLGDGYHGKCNFCVLQTGINKGAKHPHLIVDVYCCDASKYKEDKKEVGDAAHLSVSMTRSIKFLIGGRCEMFYPVGFFAIRARSS